MALAWLIIRFGPDTQLERVRRILKCIDCGKKDAFFQHRSWGDTEIGWAPFPANHVTPELVAAWRREAQKRKSRRPEDRRP